LTAEQEIAMSDATGPIACKLRPLEMAGRRELWEEVADAALLAKEPTPTGARLRFRSLAGVGDRVRTLARLEKDCCSFAKWSVSDEDDEVVLSVESTCEGVPAVQRMFELC
jgi:hypothetical protein